MIMDIISHIPWYVYLILYILIKRGVAALKDQKMPLNKLLIFPAIMTVWAFYDIQMMFGMTHFIIILSTLLGLVLGIIPGVLLVKNKVTYAGEMLVLHGSPVTLILVLAIFAFKFITFSFIGYEPELIKNSQFAIACSGGFSFIAGVTLGRFFYYLYIYKLNYTPKS